MSEPIVVAIIGALQAVLIVLLSRLSHRVTQVKRDAAVTRENVANDHTTNLREESDERHLETRRWFTRLERSIGGIRDDNRIVRTDLSALSTRVHELEQLEITQPRVRKKP